MNGPPVSHTQMDGCKSQKRLESKGNDAHRRQRVQGGSDSEREREETSSPPSPPPKASERVNPAPKKSSLIGERLDQVFWGSCVPLIRGIEVIHHVSEVPIPLTHFHTVHRSVIPADPICTLGWFPTKRGNETKHEKKNIWGKKKNQTRIQTLPEAHLTLQSWTLKGR